MSIFWSSFSLVRKRSIILCTSRSFSKIFFGRRVELVTTESLSPYIGPAILSEVEYASIDT